jgi:hypothetical protein
MRVIVQPFFMDAAPHGMMVTSAARVIVASARRARDGVVFVARLLRVRIFASLCRTRRFGFMAANMLFGPAAGARVLVFSAKFEKLQECFTGGSPIDYRCNCANASFDCRAGQLASGL